MRTADEADPKSPRGPDRTFKGQGAREAAEAAPWNEVRPRRDPDRHLSL